MTIACNDVIFIFVQPQVRNLKRGDVEKDLTFAGFVVISCPLKSDSKTIMKELKNASHHVSAATLRRRFPVCCFWKHLLLGNPDYDVCRWWHIAHWIAWLGKLALRPPLFWFKLFRFLFDFSLLSRNSAVGELSHHCFWHVFIVDASFHASASFH